MIFYPLVTLIYILQIIKKNLLLQILFPKNSFQKNEPKCKIEKKIRKLQLESMNTFQRQNTIFMSITFKKSIFLLSAEKDQSHISIHP